MYRKLVFVLTMFAVAIGSLSGAQAALASPHQPARLASAAHAATTASITTHRPTGPVRAAAASRPIARRAHLRASGKQGSLPLSSGRRATKTASAPAITSAASLAAPKITRSRAQINTACQIQPFPNNTVFTVGQFGTSTIYTQQREDFGFCTLSDGGATLPSGVTFKDNGYGWATLSGTPAAGTAGTYPFTITATNGGTKVSTLYFTLTVAQGCQITSSAGTTFTVGHAGTFTVQSTGSPTCSLTYSGNLPQGVTFHDNGDGTATLSGTPPAGTAGTYPITITAANIGNAAPPQAFTLTVDQACRITSLDNANFVVSQAGTFTVTYTGQPACTLSATGLPKGVTFTDNGDGTATLSGTPTTAGTYPVTITATNVLGYDIQNFTLTVGGAACTISKADLSATFIAGQAGTFTVTSTGPPTCTLSEAVVGSQNGLPTGVTFKDNGNGTATLSGTPDPGTETSSPYTFTITAHNSVGNDVQPFTLIVEQAGTPGIACALSTSNPASATYTVGLAGTPVPFATSAGTPTCALSATGLPAGVTLTDNGDGTATLSGTPAASTGGTYPVTITAANGVSPAATQTLSLYVLQACQITSHDADTFTVGQAGTFTVKSTGVPTCGLSDGGATLPKGVTFTDNGDGTATLSGTPAAATGGTYPLTITATNGLSPTATQIFNLIVSQSTVNQAPGITSANHATCTVRKACTFTVKSTGSPTPSLSKTGTLPKGVMFTDNGDGTATLAGTPVFGYGGRTYKFTITAKNGVSPDATQSFALTVVGIPAAPSNLKATSKGKTVSLTWKNNAKAPSAATKIWIRRSTNAKFTTGVTDRAVGPNVTSYKDTVVSGKRYWYRVEAYNVSRLLCVVEHGLALTVPARR